MSDFPTQNSILFDCSLRGIFFESDFRTQNFCFSPPFMCCSPTMDIFLVWFSYPNFFRSVHHLWVVADDGYFLGSIFGPKLIFLSVHHLWIVAWRWIFFESDFRTQTYFSFSPPFMGCGPAMDICWVRFSDPNWFFFQSTIYGLWPDDGYFLNPIFGPQYILLVYHFLDCGRRRCIFLVGPICLPTILTFFSDSITFSLLIWILKDDAYF